VTAGRPRSSRSVELQLEQLHHLDACPAAPAMAMAE
jgi:hypothetical protein